MALTQPIALLPASDSQDEPSESGFARRETAQEISAAGAVGASDTSQLCIASGDHGAALSVHEDVAADSFQAVNLSMSEVKSDTESVAGGALVESGFLDNTGTARRQSGTSSVAIEDVVQISSTRSLTGASKDANTAGRRNTRSMCTGQDLVDESEMEQIKDVLKTATRDWDIAEIFAKKSRDTADRVGNVDAVVSYADFNVIVRNELAVKQEELSDEELEKLFVHFSGSATETLNAHSIPGLILGSSADFQERPEICRRANAKITPADLAQSGDFAENLEVVRSRLKLAVSGKASADMSSCLKQVFRRLDSSSAKSSISLQNLCQSARQVLKISPQIISNAQLHQVICAVDADGSGEVSIEELVAFIQGNGTSTKERCRPLGINAAVGLNEEVAEKILSRLRIASYSTTERTVDALIMKLDKHCTGMLSFEELRDALRKIIKIRTEDLSDRQLQKFCVSLEKGVSGCIDLQHFLLTLRLISERKAGRIAAAAASAAAGTSVKSKAKSATRDAGHIQKRRALDKDMLDMIRKRLQAALYQYGGRAGIKAFLAKMDKDGSGELEEEEVRLAVRKMLKIPPSEISDEQIASLCYEHLDRDGSGTVDMDELLDFMAVSKTKRAKKKKTGKSVTVDPEVLEKVRSRLKASLCIREMKWNDIVAQLHREFPDAMDEEDVMRAVYITMQIPPLLMPNDLMSALFKGLNKTHANKTTVADLLSFVGMDNGGSAQESDMMYPKRRRQSNAAKFMDIANRHAMDAKAKLSCSVDGLEEEDASDDEAEKAMRKNVDPEALAVGLEPGVLGGRLRIALARPYATPTNQSKQCKGRRVLDFQLWENGMKSRAEDITDQSHIRAGISQAMPLEGPHLPYAADRSHGAEEACCQHTGQPREEQQQQQRQQQQQQEEPQKKAPHSHHLTDTHTSVWTDRRAVFVRGIDILPFVMPDPKFKDFKRILNADAKRLARRTGLQGAREHYRKVVDRFPMQYVALVNLACCELMLGEPRQASVLLERAVCHMPEKGCAHINLLLCLLQVEDNAGAKAVLDRALQQAKDLTGEQQALMHRCKAALHLRAKCWATAAEAVAEATATSAQGEDSLEERLHTPPGAYLRGVESWTPARAASGGGRAAAAMLGSHRCANGSGTDMSLHYDAQPLAAVSLKNEAMPFSCREGSRFSFNASDSPREGVAKWASLPAVKLAALRRELSTRQQARSVDDGTDDSASAESREERIYDIVKLLPFFRRLLPTTGIHLLQVGELIEYGIEEYVFRQADIVDFMYVVVFGSLRVEAVLNEYGQFPVSFATIYDGQSFGEGVCQNADGLRRGSSVVTQENTCLLRINVEDYCRVVPLKTPPEDLYQGVCAKDVVARRHVEAHA
eukprot:TRINITY_DN27954_c0_g1_i1.p1 TRINITY_DN27954_c0_g1~~TRINITY_DN27954_c0_g1_i1.p1  ORF type:complete len:1369 (-),score=259.62 TRINITY_DN27954_c0_g1_i1:327-4433(-)